MRQGRWLGAVAFRIVEQVKVKLHKTSQWHCRHESLYLDIPKLIFEIIKVIEIKLKPLLP